MDETLLGTIPNRPMTNAQRRAHKQLARAEKTLIFHIIWEHSPEQIEAADRRCRKATAAWKRACNV